MTSLPTFSLNPLRRPPGRTWNSSAPTPPGSLLFSTDLLSRRREWLFKAKNAERGDTLERFSISFPAPQLKCPRSPLSAGVHRPVKASTLLYTVQRDTILKFGPVFLSFDSLHSSFSLTYLRHSVSAQADYCPDVVGLLFSVQLRLLPQRFSNIQAVLQLVRCRVILTISKKLGYFSLAWQLAYDFPF